MKKMGKFYAVRNGKRCGVYLTWDECKEQISGFSGAEYKSFKTLEEANRYVRGEEDKKREYNGILCAYVDGSFDVSTGRYGSAAVFVKDGEVLESLSKSDNHPDIASMRNVAGEITASVMAMRYAVNNGYDEIVIFHDYEGIAKWCRGEWKTEREGTRLYKAFYDSVARKLKVHFEKVEAHTGVKFNEMADKLAKEALGLQ